jgi:cell division protein FtsI (penicillin-binding protein 3)
MTAKDKKFMKIRAILIGCIFSLSLGAIGAKAVYIQLYRGAWLSQKAASQYEKSYSFHGKRGTIFDTNLQEMAISVDVTSIAANPNRIADPGSSAIALSKAVGNSKETLYGRLTSGRSFEWIKRKVSPKEARRVRELNIDGIDFFTEHNRFYPNKTLSAQIIGFSGIDGHGLEGIEYHYNQYLQGTTYTYTVLKDALGRGFKSEKEISPDYYYSGNNLILTIDRTIQYITEKALAESVTTYQAKSGIAIVMSPKTGAVLSLAHYPPFNPNAFADFDRELWRNRAITDPFEPGSTMKIFTAAAAIESGACTPETVFFCENGEYAVGGNIVHDTSPHGWLSLQEVVQLSSNIGAVKISEQIGPESLYQYFQSFGFGQKTGIDCPGETAGSFAHHRQWSKIDAAAIAFGQGISVSAIQLLTATCAIANDGVLMKPFIVQGITNHSGRLIKRFEPARAGRIISIETARAVKSMMGTVVSEGGTGTKATLEGYPVCGKTGTAQKTDENGSYADEKYIASFIGFTPRDKPVLAVLVVVDEPLKQHYGGIVAAPVFKKIAGATLNYLNISPEQKADKLTAGLCPEAKG